MKLTAILGAVPSNDYGISKVYEIIKSTMNEIGEEINLINLYEANLPYHNGSAPVAILTSIINMINESDGVIFLSTSNIFAPSGIMQTFLEYLSMPVYKNTLKGKNCMTISVSHNQSNAQTMTYFSTIITYLGGYSSVNIPLNTSYTNNIEDDTKILLEKYTEDFYRYVKQCRKFFTISDFSTKSKSSNQVTPAGGVFSKPAQKSDYITPPTTESISQNAVKAKPKDNQDYKKANVASAYNSNVMDSFHQAQEDDISAITNLLSSKLNSKNNENFKKQKNKKQKALVENEFISTNFDIEDTENNDDIVLPIYKAPSVSTEETKKTVFNDFDVNQPVAKPRSLTCKQMTQNLTHYYQPHLSDGLKAIIGLNISGNENFVGHIDISGNNCTYVDSNHLQPDVTILSSDDIWKQIIQGSITTQRAFMTGQLKVRGNFVLLSKFDIIFKR